jgi:hypothetical protein
MNIKAFSALTGLLLMLAGTAFADETIVADFSADGLDRFDEKSFVENTSYQLERQDGELVLKAQTDANASALYREMVIDLKKTPYLNWSWRVDNVYNIDNQQVKAGDDYPARIYVVVKNGIFPWQTKALNYVWSNYLDPQPHWPNPFVANAIMIPVRSGSDGLGQWHSERVNIAEDYYRVFGERINKVDAVAIMSDADNAGGSAVAFYGSINFSD